MTQNQYIGKPTSETPKLEANENCRAKKTKRTEDGETVFAGYCFLPSGWGTEHVGEGRCKLHGGAALSTRPGAPEGNQRARKHGLTADLEHFYNSLDPEKQDGIDEMEKQIKQRVIRYTGGLNAEEEKEARQLAIMSHVAMNASEYTLEESKFDDPDMLSRLREYSNDMFERLEDLGVFEQDNDALIDEWTDWLESD